MTLQLYLVQPKLSDDDEVREQIATFIAQHQGFILMATSHGSLITAFDDSLLETVKAFHLVEFASGVTLNPNAPGAAALQQVFVQNMAAQITERGGGLPGSNQPAPIDPLAGRFPPGYRPLQWQSRDRFEDDEQGGE